MKHIVHFSLPFIVLGSFASFGLSAQEVNTSSGADGVVCEVEGMRETKNKENDMSEYDLAALEAKCEKGNIIYLALQPGRFDTTELQITEFVRRYCSFEHQIFTFQWQGLTFTPVACVYRGSARTVRVVE